MGFPPRQKKPPSYETVAQKIDQIEAEMKRAGLWQEQPLAAEQYQFTRAIGGDTMSFQQWLQFIFIPNVRKIVGDQRAFPTSSQVAAYAVREFDGVSADTSQLLHLLGEFDDLFG